MSELYAEIERLTRTTVNQRNELARLTFDNNHNFKATAKLQIEIERLRAALVIAQRYLHEREFPADHHVRQPVDEALGEPKP